MVAVGAVAVAEHQAGWKHPCEQPSELPGPACLPLLLWERCFVPPSLLLGWAWLCPHPGGTGFKGSPHQDACLTLWSVPAGTRQLQSWPDLPFTNRSSFNLFRSCQAKEVYVNGRVRIMLMNSVFHSFPYAACCISCWYVCLSLLSYLCEGGLANPYIWLHYALNISDLLPLLTLLCLPHVPSPPKG